MSYTLESLKEINTGYNHNHGVRQSDVEKANLWVKFIEESRNDLPQVGDIVEFTDRHGNYYRNAHIEKVDEEDEELNICEQPYVPFVGKSNKGLHTSTSGGAWANIPRELKYLGKRKKLFHAWGWGGGRANGAIQFYAEVNVWEYVAAILEFSTKTHDKFYVYANNEELTNPHDYKYTVSEGAFNKCAFRTDEEYQAWLKTYRGVEREGNWDNQIVVWTYKQKKENVPLEQYLSIENGVIDSWYCNLSMQECKRVYEGTTVTTYAPYQSNKIELPKGTKEYMRAYEGGIEQ